MLKWIPYGTHYAISRQFAFKRFNQNKCLAKVIQLAGFGIYSCEIDNNSEMGIQIFLLKLDKKKSLIKLATEYVQNINVSKSTKWGIKGNETC